MKRALLVASALLALTGAARAADNAQACFQSREMNGWRAADLKTIYLRVGLTRYYRLDLSSPCQDLADRDAHLVTLTSGSGLMCSAVDWDLGVARNMPGDMPMRCIVKTMTPLTAAEADAIPKQFKPH